MEPTTREPEAVRVGWRVGALRPGIENVVWVSAGDAPDWTTARAATIAAMRELVTVEGRQEYRLEIGDAEGVVNPGIGPNGEAVLGDLERLIPTTRSIS